MLVSRWAARQRQFLLTPVRYSRRQEATLKPQLAREQRAVPWSPPRAAWLLVRDPAELNEDEVATAHRTVSVDNKVARTVELVQRFVGMVKNRWPDGLVAWSEEARSVRIRALTSFVNGIYADFAAVHNALKLKWSAGQTKAAGQLIQVVKLYCSVTSTPGKFT